MQVVALGGLAESEAVEYLADCCKPLLDEGSMLKDRCSMAKGGALKNFCDDYVRAPDVEKKVSFILLILFSFLLPKLGPTCNGAINACLILSDLLCLVEGLSLIDYAVMLTRAYGMAFHSPKHLYQRVTTNFI